MNTKTTKFLAVLAVLAMAFSVVAVAQQSDATGANDRVAGTYVEVNGLYVHFADTLEATVAGNEVSFEGTVKAGVGNVTAYTNANYAYASISGLGDISEKITKVVQTNSALALYKGGEVSVKAPFVKTANYSETWSAKGGSSGEDYVFAIPQDASAVKLQFYSGSGTYTLEKEIVLDFTNVYTQVTLDASEIKSQEMYMSESEASATSYWHYTTTDSKVLALKDYTGNTVFTLKQAATITVEGTNNLGYVTKDGTKADPFENATMAPIYSAGTLTIKEAEDTTGSLNIDVDLGQYNNGQAAAIWSEGDMTITGLTALNINLTGSAHYKETSIDGPREHGLFSGGNITVGTSTSTLPVKMSIALDSICSAGIGSYASGKTHNLYISGSIEAGNRAIHTNYGTLNIINSGTADEPLVLSGYEAAIKTYADTAIAVINNSYLDLNLNETGGVYAGDDIRAALNIGGELKVTNGSCIDTQGYSGKRTESSIPSSTSEPFVGKLVVTDDYTQNPKAKMDTVIPGFYYKGTSPITAYNYVPTASSYIYLDLDKKDDVYGAVTVNNEDGTKEREVISEITTAAIKNSFAKTVVFSSSSEASIADVEVPETKTLLINVTAGLTGGSITCGDNAITFNADTGFIGLMQISKDGIVITDMSSGILAGAGKITLAGTIAKTKNISPSIVAAANKTVQVTLADGVTIGTTDTTDNIFSLLGGNGTMTVTATNFTVNGIDADSNSKLVLNKAAMTVNGTITDNYGQIQITDCDLTLASGAVVASNKSDVFVDLQTGGSFTVANGAVFAEADDATGFNDITSPLVIAVGTTATTNAVSGFNITNFKASYVSASAIAVEGTVADGNADSDYSAITFVNNVVVSAKKTLVINDGVYAKAAGLTVNGTLTAKGLIESGAAGFVLGNAGVIDLTNATYGGTVVLSSTDNDTIAFEINVSDAATGTVTNAMTGFTLKSIYDNDTSAYYTYLEGNLKIVGKLSSKTDTQDVSIGAAAEIISDGGITIAEGVKITSTIGATLKFAVTGPGGEKVAINAKVLNADSTITGGSLTITGGYTETTTDAGDAVITIPAGSEVTMSGTIRSGASLVIEEGAVVTIPTGTTLQTVGTTSKITVKAGAEITGAGNLDMKSTGPIDVYGTISVTGTVDDDVTYEAGSSKVSEGYLYTYYTNGSKTYAIGTLVQSFDNEVVVKEDLGFVIEGETAYTIASANIKNTNMKAVGVYSDKPTEVIVNFGEGKSATVNPSVKIAAASATITYNAGSGKGVAPIDVSISDTTTTLASQYSNGKLPTSTWADHKFLGWAISGITPIQYVTTTSTLAEITDYEDVTLVAMWKDLTTSTFTATFVSNGGSDVPAQEGIAYKGTVTEPTAPTKSAYTFVGWYTDKGLTTKYNFKSMVTDDITLYAKWTAAEPTATAVDLAVSKVTGGVKVTVAGEGDLAVPAGKITVKYWYWVNLSVGKVIAQGSATETVELSGIVNTNTVTIDQTPVYVVVSYVSDDGSVTAQTPYVFF